jgi:DNA/RNA endonuclease YhcR with UshA esterase domain
MKIKTLAASAAALTVLAANPSAAHHGDAGRFEEATTTLEGTVVALQLVNPHSVIIFNVENEAGNSEIWQAELGGPQALTRNFGWNRDTLKAGDRISVTGRVVKSGAPQINLTERARIVRLPSCEEIYVSSSPPEEPLACEN